MRVLFVGFVVGLLVRERGAVLVHAPSVPDQSTLQSHSRLGEPVDWLGIGHGF